MEHAGSVLWSLFIVYVAAQVGKVGAQSLKLPAVVGEILAGCAIGPSALHLLDGAQMRSGTPLDALAELGVILLLFAVGLETRLEDLRRVGVTALSVGMLGVAVPLVLGTMWAHAGDFDWPHALFIACAFVATSAGITARVLAELGALARIESRIILGAAVIDDILAMLLLSVVLALQSGGSGVKLPHILLALATTCVFVVVTAWGGTQVMRRHGSWLDRRRHPQTALAVVLMICLGLAALATHFGLAAIIGAFLAGMIAAETTQRQTLEHQTQPLLTLLSPFFFVLTGSKIDLASLSDSASLWLLAQATLLAVLSKGLGGYLGACRLGARPALLVGCGMIPRGEVGVVIASLGLSAGLIDQRLYAVIVAMSLLTAMLTPPLLSWLLRHDATAKT